MLTRGSTNACERLPLARTDGGRMRWPLVRSADVARARAGHSTTSPRVRRGTAPCVRNAALCWHLSVAAVCQRARLRARRGSPTLAFGASTAAQLRAALRRAAAAPRHAASAGRSARGPAAAPAARGGRACWWARDGIRVAQAVRRCLTEQGRRCAAEQ
jgi:hypothetical protein